MGNLEIRKSYFDNFVQWWEQGKTQIRIFGQQYTALNSDRIQNTTGRLENEVKYAKNEKINKGDIKVSKEVERKRKILNQFLQEQAKGALRARYITIKDIDAPSSFFIQLGSESKNTKHRCYTSKMLKGT